jgi:membrane protein
METVVDIGAVKARWRARWPWLDTALTVNERFSAVGGGPLSSSITLATFLSLFPLLLVAISVVGFVSSGDAAFTNRIIDDLGLQGEAAELVESAISTAEDSRRAASILGFLGIVWAGTGVIGALQAALNAMWQVTGRGLVDQLVKLRWLLIAGSLFIVSAGLGAIRSFLPGPLVPLNVLLGAGVTFALFLWTYTMLGNNGVGWRPHVPGALLVAVGFEVLKVLGSVYVPRAVSGSSALYGSIGVVFAILAWLAIYARLIVYGAALNVVRYERAVGTVTIELQVQRVAGEVPLTATRGGAVEERVDTATS